MKKGAGAPYRRLSS